MYVFQAFQNLFQSLVRKHRVKGGYSHTNYSSCSVPDQMQGDFFCYKKTRLSHSPVKIDCMQFDRVFSAKVLGVTIRNNLK